MTNPQDDIDMLDDMRDGYPDKGFTLEKSALKRAISAIEKQEQWISVDDHLPDCGVVVLIYPPVEFNFTQYAGVRDYHTGLIEAETQNYDGSEWVVCHVTHWMPLPSPPTQDTESEL